MDKTYIRYKCMIYKKAFQEVKKEVQDIIFFKYKKKNPIYIKQVYRKK